MHPLHMRATGCARRVVFGDLVTRAVLVATVLALVGRSCAVDEMGSAGRQEVANTTTNSASPDSEDPSSPPPAARTSCTKARLENSAEQVFLCSNEVRQDPKLFLHDYPCDALSFMNELEGGSGALEMDATLTDVSQKHADYLATTMVPSHSGPDGSTAGSRALAAGFLYEHIGENIAYGFDNARDIVFAWMCSQSHRSVLLDCRFSHMGLGVKNLDGGMLITQTMACTSDGSCRSKC